MSTSTIEILDQAIENAASFQSITVNDEGTTTNQSIASLMKAREILMQEENDQHRVRFATFNLGEQNL